MHLDAYTPQLRDDRNESYALPHAPMIPQIGSEFNRFVSKMMSLLDEHFVLARETYHTPEAVDRYLLNVARVYLAVHKRRLSPEETAFTIGRPISLVKQYSALIAEFGLSDEQVANQVSAELSTNSEQDDQPE